MANSFAESKLKFRVFDPDMFDDVDMAPAVNIWSLDDMEIVAITREGENWDVELENGVKLYAIHGIHIVLQPV